MTLRERIETVFQGGTPDAMVFFGDMSYWYSAHQQIGDLPEAWRGPRGIGQLHRDCKLGEYVPGACAYDMAEGEQVRVEATEQDGVRIRSWQTPVGSLTQRQEYSAPSWSYGFVEHAVKDVEDLRVLRYLMENRRYTPSPEGIATIDREYGDFGLPVIAVPGTPITELNKTWMGIMEMAYLLVDEQAEVEKTLQCIAESQQRLLEITERSDCGYVMVCENLTGDTMGGYFEDYMRDYLTAQSDRLHTHGKKVMLHNDGTMNGVLDKLTSVGIDCVDAATPAPVGDLAVGQLRELAGPELLILGGLPGAMFAPPFTARDMERHVKEIIRVHKDSGKFMFGVADQVPPNGDLDLVKLISELIGEHGTYANTMI